MNKKLLFSLIVISLLIVSPFTASGSASFAASKNSDVYHYSYCHYVDRILSDNLIHFSTAQAAVSSGRRPCKVCKPPKSTSTSTSISESTISSDGYWVSDNKEIYTYGTDPSKLDSDGDSLSDYKEIYTYGTDPSNSDSDGDSLNDYDEISIYETDPSKYDSDGDGLNDPREIHEYETDPIKSDTDGDSLSDYEEIFKYKTNPLKSDQDMDGLNDYEEIFIYKTNPVEYNSKQKYILKNVLQNALSTMIEIFA